MSIDPNFEMWAGAFDAHHDRAPTAEDAFQGGREFERRRAAPSQPEGAEPAMVVVMDKGAREPRIMSWNALAVGRHLMYLHPSQSAGAAAPDEGEAWQPIESVPGTPEPVLLWTRAGAVRVETGWYAKNLLEESKEDDFECAFTHWRPPLAGPKGEAATPSSQRGHQ